MDISACEERGQESLLSHTYAKKIIQSTAFLARTEHDCEAIISSRANVRFTK